MAPFQPGDRCEVDEDHAGNAPPTVVTFLQSFPEQLLLTDDAGWVRIDCEVIDAHDTVWLGHTERLRKLPDDHHRPARWDDIPLWRPEQILA